MAEEKNIIFAVLAVIVLVTAVGLVYMIKGGPGRAIQNDFLTIQDYEKLSPQFTIAPQPTYTITAPSGQGQVAPVQAQERVKDERDWYEFLATQIKSPQRGGSLVGNLNSIASGFNQRSTNLQVRFYVGTDTITAVVGPKYAFTKNPGTVGMVLSTLPNNHRIRNAKIVLIDNASCGSETSALKKIVDTLAAQSNSGSLTFATSDDRANPGIVFASWIDTLTTDVIDLIFPR